MRKRIAMVGVAWWSCALVALGALAPPPSRARVLERCELARELRRLGVRADHVPVWVCIAYHESRFDTAALNPGSGDHGLLQISELYWCGAGKACGLPCAALRDDHIDDDVRCALRVHEEHTRLQGDGFLAWVVYPQHCKQNTKKYLADCSVSLKDVNSTKLTEKSRSINPVDYKMNSTVELNPIIDELKPPYFLTTSNIGHRRNELETTDTDRNKAKPFKWHHVHFPNIDELSLPVFNQMMVKVSESPPTLTTTIKPQEQIKRTENNEFNYKFTTAKPATTTKINLKNNSTSSTTTLRESFSKSHTLSLKTTTNAPATVKPTTVTSKPRATTAITSYSGTTTTVRIASNTTRLYQSPYSRNFKSLNFSRDTSTPTPLNKEVHKKQFRCLGCRTPSTTKPVPSSGLTTTLKQQTASFFQKLGESVASNSSKSVAPSSSLKKTTTTSTTTVKSITSAAWRSTSSSVLSESTNANKAVTSETNSIFDLYLNTKRPRLTTFKFSPQGNSWYKRRIFFDGTTAPPTPWKQNHGLSNNKDN